MTINLVHTTIVIAMLVVIAAVLGAGWFYEYGRRLDAETKLYAYRRDRR